MLLKCKLLISFNCSTSHVINHNNFAAAILDFFPLSCLPCDRLSGDCSLLSSYTQLGSAQLGSARLCSALLGSALLSWVSAACLNLAGLGSALLSSAQLSLVWLCLALLSWVSVACLGLAGLSSVRLCSLWLGLAGLGWTRLDSAQLGWTRLDSARLSSARLGSALLQLEMAQAVASFISNLLVCASAAARIVMGRFPAVIGKCVSDL